jgi:hypothetical protein
VGVISQQGGMARDPDGTIKHDMCVFHLQTHHKIAMKGSCGTLFVALLNIELTVKEYEYFDKIYPHDCTISNFASYSMKVNVSENFN